MVNLETFFNFFENSTHPSLPPKNAFIFSRSQECNHGFIISAPQCSSIFSDIRSEIEAIADAADHDGYATGIQEALEQESSSSSQGFH